jgi:molybdopterin-guanine dinucleotide biosynthesis protein A
MPEVSGIILAGGRGRRMGEADKGWIEQAGQPLIRRVLDRLAPQVDDIVISANRSLERYRTLGHVVVSDVYQGFAGPLAGLHAALPHVHHETVASVPCDCPGLPLDLVARLRQVLESQRLDVVVAKSGDRVHPVFCLCRRSVWRSLDAFLAGGGRKAETWYTSLAHAQVSFDDQPEAFRNINAPEDLTG